LAKLKRINSKEWAIAIMLSNINDELYMAGILKTVKIPKKLKYKFMRGAE